MHTQPHYQRMGFKPADFPEAQNYYAQAITLPIYQTLTEEEQDRVVAVLEQVLAA